MRQLFASRTIEPLAGTWLAIQLTALLLLFDRSPVWYLYPLLFTLAGVGLLFRDLLRAPAVWIAVTLLVGAWVARMWPLGDNHHYLLTYWTLSIAIALLAADPHKALAQSARWLLVFVFAWATIWKALLSPDYMDGRFLTVRLMTDVRFEEQVEVLSGLSNEEIYRNQLYLMPGMDADSTEPRPSAMLTTPRFRFWVEVLTWGIVLAEGALALIFLLPLGRWTTLLRHGGLMAFCVGTFAFAPIAPFGWLLAILGLAQVDRGQHALRTLYVALWFLIALLSQLAARVEWGALVS